MTDFGRTQKENLKKKEAGMRYALPGHTHMTRLEIASITDVESDDICEACLDEACEECEEVEVNWAVIFGADNVEDDPLVFLKADEAQYLMTCVQKKESSAVQAQSILDKYSIPAGAVLGIVLFGDEEDIKTAIHWRHSVHALLHVQEVTILEGLTVYLGRSKVERPPLFTADTLLSNRFTLKHNIKSMNTLDIGKYRIQ